MLTLGIWAFGRDSSAVLVDDTSIVAAIEEEKLSRSAGTGGIPRLAITRCLEQASARIQDVRIAAFPFRPAISAFREAKFHLRQSLSGAGPSAWIQSLGQTFRQAAQLRQMRRLYGSSGSFLFLDHHLCHAASAYYTSPFDRALVLTLDERGDMCSGSLYLGEGEDLRPLQTLRFPNSLGWFFSRVAHLIGLRARRDEHKVQWLSKDGRPDFVSAFRKVFRWNAEGLPVLNTRYLGGGAEEDTVFSDAILSDLGLEPRMVASDPQLRASLARSARDVLEEIVLAITDRCRKQHSLDSLCVAGGLFLNVFLVRAVETRSGFKQVYVQPVAGNSGTALGAALLARKRSGPRARQPLPHLYLGPGSSSGAIKA